MSATKHKTTGDPLARLSDEELEAVSLARLASSVTAACNEFFASRGLTARPFNRDAAEGTLSASTGQDEGTPPPPKKVWHHFTAHRQPSRTFTDNKSNPPPNNLH